MIKSPLLLLAIKTLVLSFWTLSLLGHLGFFILAISVNSYTAGEILGIILLLLFLMLGEFVLFLLVVPNWLIILSVMSVFHYQKKTLNPYVLSFISNLAVIVTTWILLHNCKQNHACYTEGPLISGYGEIILFSLALFLWTFPFVFTADKVFKRISV